jgi:prepilin-type N-terminal cleavage/methylation domain-containing protein
MRSNSNFRQCRPGCGELGFSLLELMIALGVFLVIAGAAFTLVMRHIPLFASQQNQSVLNFGLRNAAAQMQIDGTNAGGGFFPGASMSSWPVGVTIEPASGDCHDPVANTYGAGCFDTINFIKADEQAPPGQIRGPVDTTTSPTATIMIAPPPGTTGITPDILKGYYKTGDQILIFTNTASPATMTTAILSANATLVSGQVQLLPYATKAGGSNDSTNDRYKISQVVATTPPRTVQLGQYFNTGDWVVKLSVVRFKVDASDSSNPKLVRLQTGDADCPDTAVPPYDAKCVIAEQVIGFKAGAQIQDPESSLNSEDCNPYCYDPASYGSNWAEIRSLRVTLIGRTTPYRGPQTYYNGFDKGPYKIEAVSVMVSPRNLSMQDEH